VEEEEEVLPLPLPLEEVGQALGVRRGAAAGGRLIFHFRPAPCAALARY
jgi:hypothetical protein